MMTEIKIRSSSLTGYTDCQLRALLSTMPHIAREHGHELRSYRPNIGALVGTGVHAAAEHALTEKVFGREVQDDDAAQAGIEAYRDRIAEEAEQDDAGPLIVDDETPDINAGERQIVAMAARYIADIVSTVRPIVVESRIECQFDDDVILSGQADLLALCADGNKRALRDLKTGRRRQSAAKHMPQQGSYSLLMRTRGHEVDAGLIDHMLRPKRGSKTPPVESESYNIISAEQIAQATLTDMATKAKRFAATGDPSSALVNPASFLCSEKFCRAHGCAVCPATRRD